MPRNMKQQEIQEKLTKLSEIIKADGNPQLQKEWTEIIENFSSLEDDYSPFGKRDVTVSQKREMIYKFVALYTHKLGDVSGIISKLEHSERVDMMLFSGKCGYPSSCIPLSIQMMEVVTKEKGPAEPLGVMQSLATPIECATGPSSPLIAFSAPAKQVANKSPDATSLSPDVAPSTSKVTVALPADQQVDGVKPEEIRASVKPQ